jgi:hypothetical protein
MKEEIQLLKEWLEAPEMVIEPDPIVDRILNEPPIVGDDEEDDQEVLACLDTAEDLVKVFTRITRPHKQEFVKRLFTNRTNFLHSNGSPRWIDCRDVPEFFELKPVPNRRLGYPAWTLSNQRGSAEYFGEWFERKGMRQKDKKFRTIQYRIRPEALTALDRIFGGIHANCQRHEAQGRHKVVRGMHQSKVA